MKKDKNSLLATNGYTEAFEEFKELTSESTQEERDYGFKVAQFLTNTFIHIFHHILGMALDPSETKVETVQGSKPKDDRKAHGSILISYFVAFMYELISPAVEMQDKNKRPMGINVNKLAYKLGVIERDEEMCIGEPEEHGDGVCVPVSVGQKRKRDSKKTMGFDDMNDMISDILADPSLEEKFKEYLANNLKNMSNSGSA